MPRSSCAACPSLPGASRDPALESFCFPLSPGQVRTVLAATCFSLCCTFLTVTPGEGAECSQGDAMGEQEAYSSKQGTSNHGEEDIDPSGINSDQFSPSWGSIRLYLAMVWPWHKSLLCGCKALPAPGMLAQCFLLYAFKQGLYRKK